MNISSLNAFSSLQPVDFLKLIASSACTFHTFLELLLVG
jgi:hypothetical protein